MRSPPAQPSEFRAFCSPDRHSFTRLDRPCWCLPVGRTAPRSIDTGTRPATLRPNDSGGLPYGLRAAGKQGTPVRFRDGPAAVTKRRSRLIRAIAGGARASVARRHPAGGAWESEDLPVFESRPDCEGRAAGTVAQAAGNASSITGRRHPRAVAATLRPRVAVSAWIRRRSRCVGRAVRQG